MNEKLIESKLVREIKKRGGIAIKLFSPWFTGLPDRMVLLPGGKISFVELKTTDEDLKPRQKIVIPFLIKLGFEVWVIDTQELLTAYLILR